MGRSWKTISWSFEPPLKEEEEVKLVSCGKPQRQQEVAGMSRRVVQGQKNAKSKIFSQAWRRHWSQRCQRHRTCFTCQFPRRQWSLAGRGGASKGCGTCLWAACSKCKLSGPMSGEVAETPTRQRHPCRTECKVEAGSMCVRLQGQGRRLRNSAAQKYQDRLVKKSCAELGVRSAFIVKTQRNKLRQGEDPGYF